MYNYISMYITWLVRYIHGVVAVEVNWGTGLLRVRKARGRSLLKNKEESHLE